MTNKKEAIWANVLGHTHTEKFKVLRYSHFICDTNIKSTIDNESNKGNCAQNWNCFIHLESCQHLTISTSWPMPKYVQRRNQPCTHSDNFVCEDQEEKKNSRLEITLRCKRGTILRTLPRFQLRKNAK